MVGMEHLGRNLIRSLRNMNKRLKAPFSFLFLGISLIQLFIYVDTISAADEKGLDTSNFTQKYTFNPNQSFVFGGSNYRALDIKESDVDYVVKSLKTIDLKFTTIENIQKLYGPVHEKIQKADFQEWKYNFLFSRELNSQQKIDYERLSNEHEKIRWYVAMAKANALGDSQVRSLIELGYSKSEMNRPGFIPFLENKLKTINENTLAIENTQKLTIVQIFFKVNDLGKINHVELNKIEDSGFTTCLYERNSEVEVSESIKKTEEQRGSLNSAFAIVPQNPYPGQIYLNTTDKHFYGWNGESWLKLDTKP